ncbi:hypothetical protein CNMCM6106_006010 [Aspergillus hiratsukae]|uniref:Mid2 domain-containing protein n=1 Tax=Aspergillus hiratsukae TaxID=1194566 RepID=A0A8H6UI60_9EURO|nr:hypothetical protein CNMCM6106_006010 [Aspergillus hiratsukae]
MSSAGIAVTATATSTTMVTTTIPMVTVYTPPASCSSSWTYEASTYNGITSGILLQNAISVDTNCFPPGFQQNGRALASQVFSPGACPDSYSTQDDFSLYAASGFVGCTSTFTGATKVAARAGGFLSSTIDYTTSTSISGTYTMWGMPIVIEVESTDRSLYTTAPSTSATTTAPSSTSSASSTSSSPTATQTAVDSSSGLSSGAKAGVGVGVGVGVGALAVLGFLGFWRRRRRKAPAPSGPPTQHFHEVRAVPVSELQADTAKSRFPITELPS